VLEEVEIPDAHPHNDQLVALANDDVNYHILSTRDLLKQADGDRIAATIVAAVALERNLNVNQLAAQLAAALVRLALLPDADSDHHDVGPVNVD
jgi:hypothetical protein